MVMAPKTTPSEKSLPKPQPAVLLPPGVTTADITQTMILESVRLTNEMVKDTSDRVTELDNRTIRLEVEFQNHVLNQNRVDAATEKQLEAIQHRVSELSTTLMHPENGIVHKISQIHEAHKIKEETEKKAAEEAKATRVRREWQITALAVGIMFIVGKEGLPYLVKLFGLLF